jgi:glutamate:GABA antiporter
LHQADTSPTNGLKRSMGFGDLVLFNVAGLISTRWLASSATAGSSALPLWLSAIVIFYIPSAIMIAGMSVKFPAEGGFYVWIRQEFGGWAAFSSGWLYTIGILFYIPTVLLYTVSIALYILGDRFVPLASRGEFMVPAMLAVLWTIVAANIVGVDVAKWVYNLGGASHVITLVLISAAAAAVWNLRGSATHFGHLPSWDMQSLNQWAQLTYALTGFEYAGLMAGEIRDPVRNLRRAAAIAAVVAGAFYMSGTAALLAILPANAIDPMNGLAQAARAAGAEAAMPWLPVVLAATVTLGLGGSLGTLYGSCARLPYMFGMDRYFPPSFAALHPRWKTPWLSILSGGVLSTLFVSAIFAGETLKAGFQMLIDMAILANSVPYIFMFAAGIRGGFRISGAIGLLVSGGTLLFSLVPPPGAVSVVMFELKMIGGLIILLASARWLYARARHRPT